MAFCSCWPWYPSWTSAAWSPQPQGQPDHQNEDACCHCHCLSSSRPRAIWTCARQPWSWCTCGVIFFWGGWWGCSLSDGFLFFDRAWYHIWKDASFLPGYGLRADSFASVNCFCNLNSGQFKVPNKNSIEHHIQVRFYLNSGQCKVPNKNSLVVARNSSRGMVPASSACCDSASFKKAPSKESINPRMSARNLAEVWTGDRKDMEMMVKQNSMWNGDEISQWLVNQMIL